MPWRTPSRSTSASGSSQIMPRVPVRTDPAHDLAVDQRRRSAGAEPEAVDRLERDRAVCRGLAQGDARLGFGRRDGRGRTHGLAGFGAAELDHVPPGGLGPEIVIEAHHPVHLGAREVERLGDHRQRSRRHMAEAALHLVQDRQERAFPPGMRCADLAHAARKCGFRLGLRHRVLHICPVR
jgi:hypothetical protein